MLITVAVLVVAIAPLAVSAIQNIFVESSQIVDIQVGNDKIDQVYVGSTLVWERCAYPVQTGQRFDYTGGVQTFTVPCDGYYEVELWGAAGGLGYCSGTTNGVVDAKGSYTKGVVYLEKGDELNAYVGQQGGVARYGWNGGGTGGQVTAGNNTGAGGGGATDVRLVKASPSDGTVWSETVSLRSRIMVAGGSGGSGNPCGAPYAATDPGGAAGGLYSAENITWAARSSQTSGNAFGWGGNGTDIAIYVGGGGGGYYGGLHHPGPGTDPWSHSGAAGGSSYISGHTGSVAIISAADQTPKAGCTTGTADNSCSVHYSGKVFADTKMIDGAGYAWSNVKGGLVLMPNPNGGSYASGVGHSGNGVARVTYLGTAAN